MKPQGHAWRLPDTAIATRMRNGHDNCPPSRMWLARALSTCEPCRLAEFVLRRALCPPRDAVGRSLWFRALGDFVIAHCRYPL
jgi:hypothetical protein